jgi:hypothetical protein
MFRCNHHHQGAHYMSLLVVCLQPHHQINHTNVF